MQFMMLSSWNELMTQILSSLAKGFWSISLTKMHKYKKHKFYIQSFHEYGPSLHKFWSLVQQLKKTFVLTFGMATHNIWLNVSQIQPIFVLVRQ